MQTTTNGETFYSIIFYNTNPVSELNLLRLKDLNSDYSVQLIDKYVRFKYLKEGISYNFSISTGSGLYDYNTVKELDFPSTQGINMFFNKIINKFEELKKLKKDAFEEDIIKTFKLSNKHDQKVILRFETSSVEISLGDYTSFIDDLDKNIEIENSLIDSTFILRIGGFSDLASFSFEDNQRSTVNKIVGLFNILRENKNKSKAEILKIINSKDSEKTSLIDDFIIEFDKNLDNNLDILESNTFDDIFKSNQIQIIEKNPDYIHKFVKLSNYIKTKSSNLQTLFVRTKEFTKNNDALLIDNTLKEVYFFKGMVHSYNLILFHSVNMVTALISDDLITFYEIYESFDKLGVFNSNWENDVSEKLINIDNDLQNIIASIQEMEAQICMQLEILTTSVESSFDSLEESVNTQLGTTNSLLGFNNLLTGVQTYQMYKINKNTKSLKN